jgi:hypothetical protein
MITVLKESEWANLRKYCHGWNRRDLEERARPNLARLLATVARRGPGRESIATNERLLTVGLSDALVAECLKLCRVEPAPALDADAYHTGDGM